ncbi:hypothetical protein BDR07DRAFT_1477909 [Suillus spraguei]|nr:hypothetical protein BDR07DRAFT_1501531 [Suillus spraguei]KAG2368712.1 hypothetical protein BDR07DRAFT_1477909 [Suillus spraguei]
MPMMNPNPDVDPLDSSDPSDTVTAADYDKDYEDVLQLAWIHKMFLGASHAVTLVIDAANEALQLYTQSHYDKQPYHTSAL